MSWLGFDAGGLDKLLGSSFTGTNETQRAPSSGALLLLIWKFDYLAALVLGNPPDGLNEIVGHAKLDDPGHIGLLVRTVCAC